MRTENFDFALPAEAIAQRPARPRDAARLLRVGERLEDRMVRDLPRLLRPGDLLVLNDTKVMPTRLFGRRGGVSVEATVLEETAPGCWRALARPARRLRQGDRVEFAAEFAAVVASKGADGSLLLDFGCERAAMIEKLEAHGAAPLPPYIRRDAPDPRDRDDYQTVFAARPGAVAAPTAGLHFTPEILDALKKRGLSQTAITLHVGYGTFQPVRVDKVEAHTLDAERFSISEAAADAINAARREKRRVVAVGTTTTRALEAAGRAGRGVITPQSGWTDLFIYPGFKFGIVDVLMTNFHLPQSSLLMLVSAMGGREAVLNAYREAVAQRYRFYSYGDAMLIL